MTGEFPVIPVPCHTHVTCHMLSLLFAVFLRKVANNFGVYRKSCIFASRTKNAMMMGGIFFLYVLSVLTGVMLSGLSNGNEVCESE